jgi:hypothetical protein
VKEVKVTVTYSSQGSQPPSPLGPSSSRAWMIEPIVYDRRREVAKKEEKNFIT